MKSELRLVNHSVLEGVKIIEIWYNNQFIGEVTGADSPGVRILTKFHFIPRIIAMGCLEVRIVGKRNWTIEEIEKQIKESGEGFWGANGAEIAESLIQCLKEVKIA